MISLLKSFVYVNLLNISLSKKCTCLRLKKDINKFTFIENNETLQLLEFKGDQEIIVQGYTSNNFDTLKIEDIEIFDC